MNWILFNNHAEKLIAKLHINEGSIIKRAIYNSGRQKS